MSDEKRTPSTGVANSQNFDLPLESGELVVRAPGLEPKSSSEELFLLLKEISTQCLEDIREGKNGTVKQLLTSLSGAKQ